MLCEKCSNIHFKPLKDCEVALGGSQFREKISSIEDSGHLFYFHHDSADTLQASAMDGCHFCEMIYGHLTKVPGNTRSPASTYSFIYRGVVFRRSIVDRWLAKKNGLQEWNDLDCIFIDFNDTFQLTTSNLEHFQGEIGRMLAALTECVDSSGHSANLNLVPDRELVTASDDIRADSEVLLPSQSPQLYSPWLDCSTISPASLALASLWLENCLRNHNPCADAHIPGLLPTRVINVSKPQEPRIEDGLGRSEPYITLSYTWGSHQRFVTTTGNVATYKAALPLAKLPLTFKDAIYFAHMLGFRWLWIDAICIIQDSPEDQEREINAMDKIFRCSTLTLFAAAGDSADSGLGVPRDPRWNKPCLLTLRTTIDGATVQGSSYVSIDCDTPIEPLYKRGWVLQEEVLSTRGLIFGSRELIWRCLCCSATESRPNQVGRVQSLKELGSTSWDDRRDYGGGLDGFDLLRMWLTKANPLPNRTRFQRNIHFDHWYNMVTNFSSRRLTYASDVLPALTGLSNTIAKLHHCTSIAGLWAEDLQVGLAWYVAGMRRTQLEDSNPPVANREHNTPSSAPPTWSWISQYGKKARFRAWENSHIRIEHEGVQLATEPLRNPKSRMSSAEMSRSLNLTGRVKIAIVARAAGYGDWHYKWSDELQYLDGARSLRKLLDPRSGQVVGQIALDRDDYEPDSQMLVHCLLCTVRSKDHKWQLTCLGLHPTDVTLEEFTRIGLVSIHDSWWFGDLDNYIGYGEQKLDRRDSQHVRTLRVI